ncbi:ATP-dependent helicase [Bacteroidetes bacterium endosymbiont of Geopemphigus sp.]|uniref:ATP-dependent helicase n=1 Tax=Bacteroidetes bacterium endosymbiont of Geopemphigus sp. TaxID=2047937 RepID=UPI000CD0EF27|nr:UvrD-helicase domain-containing protein [Bacteroidetes bacterium endosymbiont of Geopemphigus sp.]
MKADLNPIQSQIVTTIKGPMMVISGAGSGKTRVLIYRIAHLMQEGIDPFNILSLTFTNKAAREMKQRIAHLVNSTEVENLWMGTFHSVFARILRAEVSRLGYPSDYTIYDQQDAESVIKKIIEDLKLEKDLYKPRALLSRISQFKSNLITVRAYFDDLELQERDAESLRLRMGDIYRSYVDRCFKSGAMDFDDLLLRTNELFTCFPEVLYKYQERFKYIMVDEYQDTNHSQYLIVKALAARYKNLCVVGDDAQSIYAFRGANIRNILNFQLDYPDAKIFHLEQNYRSTNYIVQAANDVIACNKEQLEKKVWTQNESGEKIKLYRALSDGEEAAFIANTLFELKVHHQLRNEDFAILYRTNAQSRAIEEALRMKNIPYRIYGGLSFYQRKEIKDLLAYLRLLVNPNDEEALLRIINYPARGIGQTTINKLLVMAADQGKTAYELLENPELMSLDKGTLKRLEEFIVMIKRFSLKLPEGAYVVAQQVVKNSGLLGDIRQDDTPEDISRYENIQEFMSSLQAYVEEQAQLADGNISLAAFLENVALATDIVDNQEGDRVSLMTVHLSKGLEFPVVFIVGLEENLFPSMLSLTTRDDLEEERRLFYVALTRAQKQAVLSYALTRYRWGKLIDGQPSRFIEEIDQNRLAKIGAQAQRFSPSSLKSSLFEKIPSDDLFEISRKEKTIMKKAKHLREFPFKALSDKMNLLGKGMRVSHERFGEGQVMEIQGTEPDKVALVRFEQVGEKKLLLRFAKINILS